MTPAYLVLDSGFTLETGRPRPRGILIQIESGQRCSRVGRRRVASGWTGAASSMNEVTRILSAIEQGDPQAAEQLLPLVYDELRKLAAQKLAQEKPGQTLQATALVHEAYLRLVDPSEGRTGTAAATSSPPRPRPCAASWSTTPAASDGPKHGGDQKTDPLDAVEHRRRRTVPTICWPSTRRSTSFAGQDPLKAELVKLRYFAGLTIEQAAEALGISPDTADRYWAFARAWLHARLVRGEEAGPGDKIIPDRE